MTSLAAALKNQLGPEAGTPPPADLAAALDTEILSRADELARGIAAYRHHPYHRDLPEPPTLWQEGATRLLDYAPAGGKPLLVVPSLVNRAYILDLMAEQSLLRELAAQGLRPLLVDWGRPGEAEHGFTLTDYVAGRLERALAALREHLPGTRPGLLGYCMGGLLALALAQRRPAEIAAVAFLATPWDFSELMPRPARRPEAEIDAALAVFEPLGVVPSEVLQTFFVLGATGDSAFKFGRFAGLDPDSAAARRFVAVEDWLNDGVPLALPAARESLAGWYGGNRPAAGRWRIAGANVRPEEIACPTLVIAGARDRLAPPGSALPLAAALPRAQVLNPDLGHIGLVVGTRAKAQVWQPLAAWLAETLPQPQN